MSKPRSASEGKQDWRTPAWLFTLLSVTFGPFTVDGAADESNTLVDPAREWGQGYSFISPEKDAHKTDLEAETVFVNPPYSRKDGGLMRWVDDFIRWRDGDCTVVALLPNSTDTAWFRKIYETAAEVRLIVPRISFVDENLEPVKGNRGGNILAIWRPVRGPERPPAYIWSWDLRKILEAREASLGSS